MITRTTKLAELIEKGADTIGDIPLRELLEYLKKATLETSSSLYFSKSRKDWLEGEKYAKIAGELIKVLKMMDDNNL